VNGEKGLDGAPGRDGIDGEVGPPGPAGRDGASVTLEDVQPLIESAVARAVAALPLVPGPAGEKGADGPSGVGLMDALINRDGELVVTFTDGRTKTVGRVEGKDVDPADVVRIVTDVATKTLDAWPKPKDGAPGADGIGFDDLTFEHDEAGRLYLKFVKGTITKLVRVPGIVDLKVWRAGIRYQKGDAVTHNRSLFIAQTDHPSGKPEDASGDWRLAVMRGRDAAQPKKVDADGD
jgi:hypothetical protein